MDVAADRPQEIGAAAEGAVFLRVEHAALEQFVGLAHAVDVFRDPEQRVQIAQAALAVLDVGFDQIARLPGAAVPLFALGQLGGHEFGGGALHHLLVEPRHQFVVERLVAGQKPGLEDGGADRHVAAGLPDRFVDRARRVADLQSHVPQTIQDGLGDLLAPGGLLVGQDEQEIDVGFRRHQAAAIAAGGDHRHALGARGNRRAIEMARGGGEQDADDLVLDEAQPFGAAPPVPILQQYGLRRGARGNQFGLQQFRHGGAKNIFAAGEFLGERVDRGGNPRGIETFVGVRPGLCDNAIHHLPRYRTAPTLSRTFKRRPPSHAALPSARRAAIPVAGRRRAHFFAEVSD